MARDIRTGIRRGGKEVAQNAVRTLQELGRARGPASVAAINGMPSYSGAVMSVPAGAEKEMPRAT